MSGEKKNVVIRPFVTVHRNIRFPPDRKDIMGFSLATVHAISKTTMHEVEQTAKNRSGGKISPMTIGCDPRDFPFYSETLHKNISFSLSLFSLPSFLLFLFPLLLPSLPSFFHFFFLSSSFPLCLFIFPSFFLSFNTLWLLLWNVQQTNSKTGVWVHPLRIKNHCIGFPGKHVLTPKSQISIPDSEEPGSLGLMPFLKEIEIIEKRKEFFQMYMLWPEIALLHSSRFTAKLRHQEHRENTTTTPLS